MHEVDFFKLMAYAVDEAKFLLMMLLVFYDLSLNVTTDIYFINVIKLISVIEFRVLRRDFL